jgi:hypothetical protein
LVALGLAQFDQPDRVLELAGEPRVVADAFVELGALAQDLLGPRLIVPEGRIARERVQFLEPGRRAIPVKETSSAVPGTA